MIDSLYVKYGIKTIYDAKGVLDDAQLGWVLSCLPIDETVTGFVVETGSEICEQVYWENVNVVAVDDRNPSWVNEVVYALLRFKRPYSVIHHFAYNRWNEPEVIIEVLTAALTQQPKPEPNGLVLQQIIRSSDIERMFKKLYDNLTVPELDVAKLELAYLRSFSFKFEPKCLSNQILSSPEIYFELLTAAYKSDDAVSRAETTQKNHFSEVAYIALDRIHRVPGYSLETNTIDETKFKQWINGTDTLAKSSQYTIAHDIILGKILSYSPEGSDGIWPAECVREVFENRRSDTMEQNFIIGRRNQRGVHTLTAGKNEETIAERYKQQAERLQISYPFTASILFRISTEYMDDAKADRARELRGLYG